MSECIGLTWSELQATLIAGGYGEATDDALLRQALDRMIAAGWIKRCSRHPDRYITRRKRGTKR